MLVPTSRRANSDLNWKAKYMFKMKLELQVQHFKGKGWSDSVVMTFGEFLERVGLSTVRGGDLFSEWKFLLY